MTDTYTARWLFPVSGPPVEGGSVTLADGHIVALGVGGGEDLGEVAILPGLVNAHCHLDLTGMRGVAPPSPDFTGWLLRVIAHRRARTPEQTLADIHAGIEQSLAAGTTLLGDISGDGASAAALAGSPLSAVVFREVLGLTPERAALATRTMTEWGDGVSPHAPYSCHVDLYRVAAATGRPVCTHLAESTAEVDLLAGRTGPFVDFLKGLGVWHPDGLAGGPGHVIELLDTTAPVLLAHGNHLGDERLPDNFTVVYCPRTHAAFGHPPHPAPWLLARGVRVALGTDGLASNPDLSILEEMRFLHRHAILPPGDILRAATLSGAEALGRADQCGSLGPGKRADLIAVPLGPGRDPWDRVLSWEGPPRVMIGGRWITA